MCERLLISIIAGLPRKSCIDTATKAATAVLKNDHVLNVIEATELIYLLSEAVDTREASLHAGKTVCCVYNEDFQNPYKTPARQVGEDLPESVDLSLSSLLYFVRCHQNVQNEKHGVFNKKDIEAFCKFEEILLKRVGHGHNVYSTVKSASWWWRFCASTEEGKEFVGETKVFVVKQTSFLYSLENGNYLQDLQLNRPRHSTVVEEAVFFWRKKLPSSSMITCVCYNAPG